MKLPDGPTVFFEGEPPLKIGADAMPDAHLYDPDAKPKHCSRPLDPAVPDETEAQYSERESEMVSRAINDPCYMADIITASGMTPADYGVWVAQMILTTEKEAPEDVVEHLRAGVHCMIADELERAQ